MVASLMRFKIESLDRRRQRLRRGTSLYVAAKVALLSETYLQVVFPLTRGGIELPAVANLDFRVVGDSKVTWELNRHQHLVTLAKAYRVTGDRSYANETLRQWRH